VPAVGDGALGFWNALSEVFPMTRHQRCWGHKTANCLDALPKSAQPAAKRAIQEIYNAEDKEYAARVTKGAGSRAAALAMVFKLIESAQARWRAVNAPHQVARVRVGARFERGRLVERPEGRAA
jgi:putative transposase